MSQQVKRLAGSVVLLLMGAGCLWVSATLTAEHEAMADWEVAEGIIKSSEVVSKLGGRRGQVSGYGPAIRYAYAVGEQDFYGTRLAAGGRYWAAQRWEVESWIKPYPVGESVSVYFDPKDPTESVLDRADYGKANIGALVAGLLFGGIGLLGFIGVVAPVVFRRKSRHDGP